MAKHKLTPAQEARLVVALECLSKCKQIELAIMKTNVELMGHLIEGKIFDRKAEADRIEEALGLMHKLRDELIFYRNMIDDRRTTGQAQERKRLMRSGPGYRGIEREHQLPARLRKPDDMIHEMAQSIAKRRATEEEQPS